MVNAEADSEAPVGSAGATEPPTSSSDTTVNKALEWMHQLPSMHVMAISYHLGQSRFNKLNLKMSLLDAVVKSKNITKNHENWRQLTVQYRHVLNCMKNLN